MEVVGVDALGSGKRKFEEEKAWAEEGVYKR
jgi:hypothetical protein